MTSRRQMLVVLAGVAAALGGAPALAQSSPRRRIGLLSPQSATSATAIRAALVAGLAEHGWREGSEFVLDARYSDGSVARLSVLASELAQSASEVIVAGSNHGVLAIKRATSTIPIVMVTTGDPVGDGLVQSLARPGGNITGMTTIAWDTVGKWCELLKELSASAGPFAVLANPDSPYFQLYSTRIAAAARSLGIEIAIVKLSNFDRLATALRDARASGATALLVTPDILFITGREQLVAQALEARLPTMYTDSSFVHAGGLASYGASLAAMYRHAARHVDRILRGARPADLPVEQATIFELAINLKTAKAHGLTVPPTILLRADEVIE